MEQQFQPYSIKIFNDVARVQEIERIIQQGYKLQKFLNEITKVDPGLFTIGGEEDEKFCQPVQVGRLGYHACVWRMFRVYTKNRENLYFYIDSSPYIKLVIDVDFKNGVYDGDIANKISSFLTRYGIKDTFTITSREVKGGNIHIIFSNHYDVSTYRHLSNEIKKNFDSQFVKIDLVETWTLPGSREHYYYNDSSSAEDRKLANNFHTFISSSPVNVWSNIDIFTLLSETSNENVAGTLTGGKNTVLSFSSHIENFSKFESIVNRIDIDETNITFVQTSFALSDIFGIIAQQNIPIQKMIKIETVKSQIGLELYEALHYNSVTVNKPFKEMYKNLTPYVEQLANNVVDFNEFTPKFSSPNKSLNVYEEILKKQKIPQTQGMIELLDSISNLNIQETWCGITIRLKNKFINDGYYSILKALYKQYCERHQLIMEIDESNAIKHIFEITINNLCVTSVLALFLQANMFESAALVSSIYFLLQLNICETARTILAGYISTKNLAYINSLTSSIIQSFHSNDCLYVLAELYDGTYFDNLNAFKIMINNRERSVVEVDESMEPPKKKKKGKAGKEGGNKLDSDVQVFEHHIMRVVGIGSKIFIFQDGAYTQCPEELCEILKERKISSQPVEPSHGHYWYIRHKLLYYSPTQSYELHTPSFFPSITLVIDPSLSDYEEDMLTTNDVELISFLFSVYLKMKDFLKFLKMQELLSVVLCPILDCKIFNNKYADVNIHPSDLKNIMKYDNELKQCISLEKTPYLYKMMRHLTGIICEIDELNRVDLHNPQGFITATLLDVSNSSVVDDINEYKRKQIIQHMDPDYSFFFHTLNGLTIDEDLETNNAYRQLTKFELSHDLDDSPNTLNILRSNIFFNSIVVPSFANYNIADVDSKLFTFTFSILSWYIRYTHDHRLSGSYFFIELDKCRNELYNELVDLLENLTGGRMCATSIYDYANILKCYCENTTVEIDEFFQKLLPPHIPRLSNELTGRFKKYETEIYVGFASFLLQSQFNIHLFEDLLKYFSGVTHKGNFRRIALALLLSSKSGKSQFIKTILGTSFKSLQRNILNKNILENSANDRGNLLMDELHGNLVISIDEVEVLDKNVKIMINTDVVLSKRNLYSEKFVEQTVNANIIVMANDEPMGKDEATCLRIIPMPRTVRYVNLTDDMMIRNTTIADYTTTTKYIGTQILLERLVGNPIGGDDCKLGYYLLIWNMVPIFFNTFAAPVSLKNSEFLENCHKKYILDVLPGKFFIENSLVCVSPIPIKISEFEKQIALLYHQYKTRFQGAANPKSTCSFILEMMKKQIHGDLIYASVIIN